MSLCGLAWLAVCLSAASSRRPEDSTPMVIEEDKLFSAFLYPGKAVSFFYLLQQEEVSILSFTVTPCTAPVAWDIVVRNTNETGKVEEAGEVLRPSEEGPTVRVLSPAYKGLYTVQLRVQQEAWVQLYVTYLSHPSQLRPVSRLHLVNRRTQGQIFVRWQRTTVDPDETEYVIVVHRGEEALQSLCKAGGEMLGVQRPKEWTVTPGGGSNDKIHPPRRGDIVMDRVGKRTSWLVRDLEPKERYHVEVFAVNINTNFSYRYAAASNVTYRRPKPLPLQDGKQAIADLRRSEPRAAFRYKVREAGSQLEVGVTACGSSGSVLAELRQRGSAVGDKATISGHGVLRVSSPQQGAVFVLRLRLPPHVRSAHVQVTATTKGLDDPVLPELAVVHEYKGLRTCNQLTLGWVPVQGEALYCVTATQVRRKDVFHQMPDQCAVEQALNSLAYSVLQCSQIVPKENQTVITEPITNLKPGKQYDIQVSVKKGNSKVLSYELIRVRTKNSCK
ncbi:protein NDNF [Halyomorpha halys]|uniref:protein NDNF n=1 Tax=Halyomorpha halys TaxID=286706 RepID=UPI0006D4FF6A|nr:protein NDNF [Halyomorpha halys]